MRAVSCAWRRVGSLGGLQGGRDARGSGEATETAPRTAGSRTRPSTPAARCGGRSAGSGGRSPCRCGTWRARSNGRAQSAARWRGLRRAGSDATSPERDMGKGVGSAGGVSLCGVWCRAQRWERRYAHLLEVVLKLREDDCFGRAATPLLPPPLAPRLAHHLEDVFGGAAADARGERDLTLLLHPGAHGAPYGPPDRFGQREVRLRVTDHQRLQQIDQLGSGAVAARATGPETSRAHRLAPPAAATPYRGSRRKRNSRSS